METKVEKAETRFTLVLSEDELIHLEAAMDAFTSPAIETPADFLGMYESRYDSELALSMFCALTGLRDEIS